MLFLQIFWNERLEFYDDDEFTRNCVLKATQNKRIELQLIFLITFISRYRAVRIIVL